MPDIVNDQRIPLLPTGTWGVSWPLITALTAFLGVLWLQDGTAVLGDPDTYWHIAAGRWITEHAAVPQGDPFSHSMPGAPWTAHEWLSEVLISTIFQWAGWPGLIAMTALSLAATLAWLCRFLLARLEPVHALILTVLALGMLKVHMVARPHVLVWPLVALWVGMLVDASEKRTAPPWGLLPIMTLWANLHGSFIFGLALGGALGLDAVLARPAEERKAAALGWAGFIGLSILAATLTPAGWHGLWFPFQLTNLTVATSMIGEWLSPNFHQPQFLELWLLTLLGVACLGRVRLSGIRLLLLLVLVHLALKHHRHATMLGLVAPFLMAAPLACILSQNKQGKQAETLDRIFTALAAPARHGALLGGLLLASIGLVLALAYPRHEPPVNTSPAAALAAARKAGAEGPVLNDYNFGGYLIHQGVLVFIDGRADMYGDSFLKRYLDAISLRGSDKLSDLLQDYGIGWTLLRAEAPAAALLDRLPGWRRIYADKVAVVHIRATEAQEDRK